MMQQLDVDAAMLSPDDIAAWRAYCDWQDRADDAAGDPEDCGCCLSVRGRHCQDCHAEIS
ncbi:MAG TPA: hypothetical protein VFW64_12160 [Pseudonocardiaceae bacterium]|nr:hypothetical protein [Pseudonocardiaceae bacterium]